MVPNRIIAKDLISNNLDDILNMKNRIIHNGRLLFVKMIEFSLFGHTTYAYIAIDYKRKYEETVNMVNNEQKCKKLSDNDLQLDADTDGTFILISSLKLEISEILPYYSSRNYIEQVFDVSKNNALLLHLRVHTTDAIKGHILINFLTVISYMSLNKLFDNTKYSAKNAFYELSFLIGKHLNNQLHIYEPNKSMKKILDICNLSVPKFIDLSNNIL
jgi:transposase